MTPDKRDDERKPETRKTKPEPGKIPPSRGAGGTASSLQPGGTLPGGGPGASQGSLGTGGGSTGGSDSGAVKRGGR